jgi:hypothetical protein
MPARLGTGGFWLTGTAVAGWQKASGGGGGGRLANPAAAGCAGRSSLVAGGLAGSADSGSRGLISILAALFEKLDLGELSSELGVSMSRSVSTMAASNLELVNSFLFWKRQYVGYY